MDMDIKEIKKRIRARDEKIEQWHNGPHVEFNDPRHGAIMVTSHVNRIITKDRAEACPQRTPEWYAKRNNHVTASLMATICNANPYETRSSAIKKKTGVGKPFTGNEATRHGNKYELEAIQKYEAISGRKCIEFGLLESLNEGEEHLAGSPDGITSCSRLIEVKCPFRRVPTEVVPEVYIFQVQFLMHTLLLKECDFIQYVPGGTWTSEKLFITRVPYDPYFWYARALALDSFWEEVMMIRVRQESRGGIIADLKKEEEIERREEEVDTRMVINIEIPGQAERKDEEKRMKKEAKEREKRCEIIVPDGNQNQMQAPFGLIYAMQQREEQKERASCVIDL